MKDAFGNILEIGDEVVFVHSKNSFAELKKGIVTKFYKNTRNYDEEECSVGSCSHILSHRICKIKALCCDTKMDEEI